MNEPSSPTTHLSLAEVRREIDAIDSELLRLLDARARLASAVAAAKRAEPDAATASPLRPARETAILRDRLGAPRQGAGPRLILKVWRELMGESLALQGGLDIRAWGGRQATAVYHMARCRFGAANPVVMTETPEAALKACDGPRGVAVLSLETGQGWWARLLLRPDLVVFSTLPELASEGPMRALVVGPVATEPTGHDLTLWVTDAPEPADQIIDILGRIGFAADLISSATGLKLFALSGYVQKDDIRLLSAPGRISGVIGAVAAPFDE
ncbi:MAG: chorismate mutase [Asticcacaulis sp.]